MTGDEQDGQERPVRYITREQWRREQFFAAVHDPDTAVWVIDPAKNRPAWRGWSPAGDTPAEPPALDLRTGRQSRLNDPNFRYRLSPVIDEAALLREPHQEILTRRGRQLVGTPDSRPARPHPAKVITMASTPPESAPNTPVTVLLIVLVAVGGLAAIALLTIGDRPWLGLALLACTLGLLLPADRRLRRRAQARRAVAAEGAEQPESTERPETNR